MPVSRRRAATVVGVAAAACAPTLDWREVRVDGGLVALLPCKPARATRAVRLAGATVSLTLDACSAGGQTWAVGVADVADPTLVTPAIEALRRAAAGNLGASAAPAVPGAAPGAVDARAAALAVPGATPNVASARLAFSGRLPDGASITEQVGFFAKGTRVYQATVLGNAIPSDAAETFFGSLRFR